MAWALNAWRSIADLVLPATCAGCGAEGPFAPDNGAAQLCDGCAASLARAQLRWTVPDPCPTGFPPCVAADDYGGATRSMLLAYKERGAYRLAAPLAQVLARAVARAVGDTPVALVGVPSTPSAVRERHGDHVARLGRQAAAALRAQGHAAAYAPGVLRAVPKADATHLDAHARAEAAANAFRIRPERVRALRAARTAGVAVVVIDDIVTTGATLAAASRLLASHRVEVHASAVIAATRRWSRGAGEPGPRLMPASRRSTDLGEIRPLGGVARLVGGSRDDVLWHEG